MSEILKSVQTSDSAGSMNIKDNAVAASPAIPGPWSLKGDDLICYPGKSVESLRMFNHLPNRDTDTIPTLFLGGVVAIQLHQYRGAIMSSVPGDLS